MNVNRRGFLVGCGALFGAGYFVGSKYHPGRGASDASRHLAALARGAIDLPVMSPGQSALNFFALGDTGWQSPEKVAVAAAMAETARRAHPDLILLLGDNFYRSGVASVGDGQWKTHFEDAFAAPELQVPFRPILGNHDHNGDIDAQVAYSAHSARWKMDGLYYSFSQPVGPECSVEFFLLDTTPLRLEDDSSEAQIRWLESALAASRAKWKIVAGHHPIVSGGKTGGSSNVRDAIEPSFVKHGVDLYLSGHDHDLQLLKTDKSYLQLVSGAGSSNRPVEYTDDTLFAESEPGFARILVTAADLWIQFVTAEDGPRFVHRISKGTPMG